MSRKDRPNATGRNNRRTGSKGAVIILRRSFWESPQVSVLTPTARALLVELTAMYSGPDSNGKLFLSVRDAAHRLGLNDTKAASAAIHELLKVGLLVEAAAGHFGKAGRNSRARAFWINWKDEGGAAVGPDALPNLDYANLSPRQKRRVESRSRVLSAHRKRNFSVGESLTLGAVWAEVMAGSVGEAPTFKSENGEKSLNPIAEDSPTHIYYQGGRGAMQPNVPLSPVKLAHG